MSSQPDHDREVHQGDVTDDLANVAEILAMVERLLNQGFELPQITDHMWASGFDPPGGGSWDDATVARIITVMSTVRSEGPPPAYGLRGPIPPRTRLAPARFRRADDVDSAYGANSANGAYGAYGANTAGAVRRRVEDPPMGGPVERELAPPPRWVLPAATALAALTLGAAAWAAITQGGDRSSATRSVSLASETITEPDPDSDSESADRADQADPSAPSLLEAPADGEPGPSPEKQNPNDMMAIRVEPETAPVIDPKTGQPIMIATATIRADGLLHLEGAFPSRADAARYVDGMAEVFGRDAIVESYEINPAAPLPDTADVALDKPVLFASGTATIDPSFVGYLEACGDVLRLNPHITMSIAAFADSTGPDDVNMELSKARAQAIYDFYRSVDVDAAQLEPLAFGEIDPVADNTTPDGRAQNRRAMLRLLNVLSNQDR